MRIDSLDGLRGIAIIAVLFIHHALFNNGWMGVDLFFVLSGFLITQILRKEREEPFYWKRFYIKRATRILPPMVLTIFLAFFFTPGASILATAGYLLSLGGFIGLTSHNIAPLGPLWSLAVEEHFYLAWPFAVRLLPRRWLIAALALPIAGSPLLRLAYSHPLPTATLSPIYFITPFRIDEMAYGCLLAILIESQQSADWLRKWSKVMFLFWSGIYLALWIHLRHIYFFPGAHTKLFDCIGYSLVAMICMWALGHVRLNPLGWASRLLSFKPLTFVGRISYGVYLYHLLIKTLVMWLTGLHSERTVFFLDFPVVLLLSWLSFEYYETPFIAWGRRRADIYRPVKSDQTVATSIRAEGAQSVSGQLPSQASTRVNEAEHSEVSLAQ